MPAVSAAPSVPDAPLVANVSWHGHPLELHPEGAVVRERVAWVADTHFGKPASFRRLGVPVPDGGDDADAARLTGLLHRTGVTQLVILGDLLHDAASQTPETIESLRSWRARHPNVDVVLVRGNHDLKAGDPPDAVGIRCVDPPFTVAGVAGLHHPPERRAAGTDADAGVGAGPSLFFAGHLHPVAILHGAARRRERCRCFHVRPDGIVLPAFGSFTGGMVIRPRRGDRVFAVGPGAVVEVRGASAR
ncbi:MAG: ligase-associated DNA damage response endonuclease PdeM [Phycisphaerales bacterium]